jgi:integrase
MHPSVSANANGANRRQMIRAELLGAHTHAALSGVEVHVWKRGDRFLARGRALGQSFGETLGSDPICAAARLRQVLNQLDNGSYVRPSEARKLLIAGNACSRLSLREIITVFLAEKRKRRGQQTAADYRSRLAPVLDFAEKSSSLKRWPLAVKIDTHFVQSLRAFLFQHQTSRNGRPGSKPTPLSNRQIINILECLRTVLHWAKTAAVRKLPADWVMPLTQDLIGQPPTKDPLRQEKLSIEDRCQIVRSMDCWQICQLTLSLVLPLRPGEAAGILVSDVNLEKGWLEFGERFKDANFTKGKTSFVLPFPAEMRAILLACIAQRAEGPLLRSRRAFAGEATTVRSLGHLQQLFNAELATRPAGTVQAEQDRKLVFRSVLQRLGGVTEDALNKEFKKVLAAGGIKNGATIYALRSAVTTGMHRANLPHLEMRYLTGHTTSDILNEYTCLDPVGAMNKYFSTIQPLLSAIAARVQELGVSG